jgi:hypothetical protein
MGRKKSLSYAEHQEIAARIKEARKLLMDIAIRVANGLGGSKRPTKTVFRILNLLDHDLKGDLDRVLFEDHRTPENVEELKALYYGPTADNKVVLHRSRGASK